MVILQVPASFMGVIFVFNRYERSVFFGIQIGSGTNVFYQYPRWKYWFLYHGRSTLFGDVGYQTLVPSEVRLPSVPVHLGSLPDTNTAFVSQEHNLGRISFFDTDVGELQTITGFELNSAIDHAE